MRGSVSAVFLLLALVLAACNQPAAPSTAATAPAAAEAPAEATEAPAATEPESEPATAPADTQGAAQPLSVPRVEFATGSSDAQDLMITYSTAELFWPSLGFTEPAEVIVTEDYLPALVAGEVWVVQGDTSTLWTAMDEGSLDLVMVGIDKDNEVRILGSRPGIASVEDIEPGMTASGGSVGEYDELVLREILTDMGVNPDELEIIAMGGGADARMQALIAEQLDLGIQQPRNIGPLTRAGGAILYEEAAELPQEVWVVQRGFMETNRDAVCAFVKGRIMGKAWASEGEDMQANMEEALEIVRRYQVDPSEDELADWTRELQGNQSLDGGATIEGLENLQNALKQLETISADFDWRDHADFSCLWEAQAELGLEQRPASE